MSEIRDEILATLDDELHGSYTALAILVEAGLRLGYRDISVEGVVRVHFPRDMLDKGHGAASGAEVRAYLTLLARAMVAIVLTASTTVTAREIDEMIRLQLSGDQVVALNSQGDPIIGVGPEQIATIDPE